MYFDETEFRAYMHQHSGVVYAFLLKRVSCSSDADDLLQELFIRLYKRLQYMNEYPSSSWLFTVARRLLIDLYRKNGRQPETTNMETTPESLFPISDFDAVQSRVDYDLFFAHTQVALEERDRMIFWMHARHGFTFREIGERLGLAKSTVNDSYRRTVDRMKEYFSDETSTNYV